MTEVENEENVKNTIQDTQILIRNHMQQHKKISKQLHSQIKKDLKTVELYKEKIGKLIVEKEKLEAKKQNKNDEISRKKYLILQVLPERFRPQENDDEYSCLQKILDFISGLTDFGAVKLYKELTAKILT